MKKFKLRDYQADDLKRINKEIKAGHKRVLYSLMTAGGKTVVLHEQVSRWLRKGLRGCVLVHTRALLNQTCAVFSDIPHGIIAGGIKSDPDKRLQICMVQSLARRGGKAFDFIVVDEAHHATASTWARILADSPEAIILGVTATPFRHDNRGLGQAGFTTLVEGPEVSWLTEQGFLSPVEYYAPTDVDMTGVKKVGGDYEKKESSRRANKPTITGSAVEHYKRHANGQRALVFCADIKHVLSVTKKFKKAGLNAAFIHGKMTTDGREDVLLQFAESKDMILVSCELIGEGLDVPAVACVILLRPTASLVRFIQQVGRGLRVVDGKKHVVVLDHVGNIRLGHPHVRREVDLNGIEKKAKNLDENSPKSYLRTCPKCKRVETADVLKCSTCGHKFKVAVRGNITTTAGSLIRLDGHIDTDPVRVVVWHFRHGSAYKAKLSCGIFQLGKDEIVAKRVGDLLLDYWQKNNAWPGINETRKLIASFLFLAGRNLIPIVKLPSSGGNCFSIKKVTIHVSSDDLVAQKTRAWMLDWYAKNGYCWPERKDEIHKLGREARFHTERIDSLARLKRLGHSKTYQLSIMGNIHMIAPRREDADVIRSKIIDAYKNNSFSWPSRDVIAEIITDSRKSLGIGLPKIVVCETNRHGNTRYGIFLKGTKARFTGCEQTANAARDYLLKFYESNNYEWPPKSEVPALVKRALEHARSTVE